MKLARRETVRLGAVGALLGALAGHYVSDLGCVLDQFRGAPAELTGALVGLGAGVAGWLVPLALCDAALLILYVVVAFTPVIGGLTTRWVRDDRATSADAVVVLSSGVASNGGLDETGLDRLLSGLEIIRARQSSHLVTTRFTEHVGGRELTPVDDQRRTISLVGVPRWDVIGPVSTTRDEAVKSAALLLPSGERRIIVVTSPMHTRRACAAFTKVGFDVTCVAAFEHDLSTWRPRTSRERLAAVRAYVYERAGLLKYRWRGWI